MIMLRGGLAALVLLGMLAAVQKAQAQCFWDRVHWVCWTSPLFPELSVMPDASPYRLWAPNWGGPNWRFYGWEAR